MQVAIGAGIVCNKSFNGLNSNFCAAIGMWRNLRVTAAANSGPPSDAHSSGMPNVVKVCCRHLMSPSEPAWARSIMGQLEYSVHHYEVVDALVVEKICANVLEWVCG